MAPRPNNNPIEETVGFVDVIHRIRPTLERIAAEIMMENSFSSRAFFSLQGMLAFFLTMVFVRFHKENTVINGCG